MRHFLKIMLLMVLSSLVCLPSVSSALGLSNIELYSTLNQPLNARIKLFDLADMELDDISVKVASANAFDEVGIERTYYLNKLRFELKKTKQGQAYIKITSTVSIHAPILNFLVDVSWPNGQLVRKYTLLLNPPSSQQQKPVILNNDSIKQKKSKPTSKPKITKPLVKKPAKKTYPTQYGPTKKTDTLWHIASTMRPDSSVSVDQMMLAIFHANPKAFNDDNINGLKSGYTLVLPTLAQLHTVNPQQAEVSAHRHDKIWLDKKFEIQKAATQTKPAKKIEPVKKAESVKKAKLAQVTKPAVPTLKQTIKPQPAITITPSTTTLLETNAIARGSETGNQDNLAMREQVQSLREQLAVSNNTLTAARKANQQLEQRLAALEKQTQALQKLLLSQRAEMAQMRARASKARTSVTTVPKVMTSQTSQIRAKNTKSANDSSSWLYLFLLLVIALVILLLWYLWRRGQLQLSFLPNAVQVDEEAGLERMAAQAMAEHQANLAKQAQQQTSEPESEPEPEPEPEPESEPEPEPESEPEPDLDTQALSDALPDLPLEESNQSKDGNFDIVFEPGLDKTFAKPDKNTTDETFESVPDDPLETKLELAKAYIGMAQQQHARPLLEEVIADGNTQQKQLAAELLAKLS